MNHSRPLSNDLGRLRLFRQEESRLKVRTVLRNSLTSEHVGEQGVSVCSLVKLAPQRTENQTQAALAKDIASMYARPHGI